MNAINLFSVRKKSPYKLDPNSDRYRECPNDGVKFMANHRGEKFCCDKCADEFHNLKKKEATESLIKNEPIKVFENQLKQISEPQTEFSIQPVDKVVQNIKLLDNLEIDAENGTHFNMDWMFSIGYDFENYTGQGKLYNIDPALNCHFIQIGPYRLFRTEFSSILIKKII